MKSPLRKRLPRELKSEFGKYLVVFIMMAITIAFVSGFLVADGSMIRAYDDSFQKYNIENGYFRTKKKLTTTQKEDIEKSDVKISPPLCSELLASRPFTADCIFASR